MDYILNKEVADLTRDIINLYRDADPDRDYKDYEIGLLRVYHTILSGDCSFVKTALVETHRNPDYCFKGLEEQYNAVLERLAEQERKVFAEQAELAWLSGEIVSFYDNLDPWSGDNKFEGAINTYLELINGHARAVLDNLKETYKDLDEEDYHEERERCEELMSEVEDYL